MPEGDDRTNELDGWERHRRDQLLTIARRTTPAQRLEWLEAAIEFARGTGALPDPERS